MKLDKLSSNSVSVAGEFAVLSQLAKIDLLDSNPLEDVFDEEKYNLLEESENIVSIK